MSFAFFILGMMVGILILDRVTGRDAFADILRYFGFKNSR